MKRIYLAFCITVFCVIADAQNYTITMYDTVKYGNPGDLLLPTVTFSNTSANPIQMHFRRIVKNIPTGWTSCFCAPTCIAQTQDTLNFTIPATGDKNNPPSQNVTPNFGTDSVPGVGEVIVVFNEVGVNHYDTITFRGITSSLSGIKSYEKDRIVVLPNPSSDFIAVKNSEKNIKFVQLLDVNGKLVLANQIKNSQEEIKLDITSLCPGTYSLLLQCTDNSVYRKKIIKS